MTPAQQRTATRPVPYLGLALLLGLAACGPRDVILGRVVDATTQRPLSGVVISGERGGLYVDNPDKTVGNPAYIFGAITDDEGFFEMKLREPVQVGLHTFIGGYRYGSLLVFATGEAVAEVGQGKLLAKDVPPTVSNVAFSRATVAPGEEVELSAEVVSGTFTHPVTGEATHDPLSEEVVLVHPEKGWSVALDPPFPGGKAGEWPDGVWTTRFPAPAAPGLYDYYFAATSEHCVTAELVKLQLTVE
jgi:hypothetical protein